MTNYLSWRKIWRVSGSYRKPNSLAVGRSLIPLRCGKVLTKGFLLQSTEKRSDPSVIDRSWMHCHTSWSFNSCIPWRYYSKRCIWNLSHRQNTIWEFAVALKKKAHTLEGSSSRTMVLIQTAVATCPCLQSLTGKRERDNVSFRGWNTAWISKLIQISQADHKKKKKSVYAKAGWKSEGD